MQKPRTVSEHYPPQWLKPADLEGRGVVSALIERVTWEERYIPQADSKEWKWVLKFEGKALRLILNKTQELALAKITGTEEYEKWVGHTVGLKKDKAPNGRPTIGIVAVRQPDPTPPQEQAPPPDQPPDVFESVEAAIDWAEAQKLDGATREDLYNYYEVIKQQKEPKNARQMRDFWVAEVAQMKAVDEAEPPAQEPMPF